MKGHARGGLFRLAWFFFFGGVYISCLCLMITSATLIRTPAVQTILLSFGAALAAGLVFYSKKTALISLGTGAGALLVYLFALCDSLQRQRLLERFWAKLEDIGGQIMGAPYRPADGLIIMASVSCIFALVGVPAFYKRISFWLAAAPPLICYLMGALGKYGVNVPAALLLFFCLVLLFFLSRRQKAQREMEKRSAPVVSRGGMRGLLPACALLSAGALILSGVLPLVSGPSQGIRAASPRFSDLGDFLDSIQIQGQWFNITGFSDGNTMLGGDLYLDDSRVMDVRAPGKAYLTGTTYRLYNGTAWLEEGEDKSLCNPDDLDGRQAEALFTQGVYEDQRITVTMRQSGDVLFYPERPASFRLPQTGSTVLAGRGSYYIQPLLTPGDSYTVSARQPDFTASSMQTVLQTAGRGFYKSRGDADMAAYAEAVRRDYTQLPDTLPMRVKQLAEEITAATDSPVIGTATTEIPESGAAGSDYGRAKAIEQYLCANYTYTLQPGNLPEGEDFADYFLFEKQEGYCTHYATAMTVLCRAAGLPARYVKGFMTPAAPNASGVYEVTGRTAHAWTEVYIEGLGWTRFEPTSAFNSEWNSHEELLAEDVVQEVEYLEEIGFYYEESPDGQGVSSRPENTMSAPAASATATSAPARPSSSETSAPASDSAGGSETSSGPASSALPNASMSSGLSLLSGVSLTPRGEEKGGAALLISGGTILVLAAMLAAVVYLQVRRVKRRLLDREKASGKKRAELTFWELLRLAEYLGGRIKTGETAAAFARRLAESPGYEILRLEEAAALYEKIVYSTDAPEKEDVRALDAIYEEAMGKIRAGMSGVRYFRLRYLQGRI